MKDKDVKTQQTGERLQKVLAGLGFASRREIERWIVSGRIRVNGQLAKLGDRVTQEDRVTVDKRVVRIKSSEQLDKRVLIYNKPVGQIVAKFDPEGRASVFDGLPRVSAGRWISVGRLDINTSGLLLFTTDGDLAHKLMHPSSLIQREYAVRVLGKVTKEMIDQLITGVELEDGKARFEDVVESESESANRWFHVVIMEGRKREVRRLWEAVGAKVSRLKRVRYGPVMFDGRLREGHFREAEASEMKALYQSVEMQMPEPSEPKGQRTEWQRKNLNQRGRHK